jgi:hypothetical protein
MRRNGIMGEGERMRKKRIKGLRSKEGICKRGEGGRRKFMILSGTCLPLVNSVMNSSSGH